MDDPKLDELVFRGGGGAPVDPTDRLRERMVARAIVRVAGGGGDGGPEPGAVVIPGIPFAGGQAPRAQGFQRGRGVQDPEQALPAASYLQGTTPGVQMLPARTTPVQGLLQPRSLAPMPGLLPKSPHPMESTRWVPGLLKRQDPVSSMIRTGAADRTSRVWMEEQVGASAPAPSTSRPDPLLSWPSPPCDEVEISRLLDEASGSDPQRAAKAMQQLEAIASRDIGCLVKAIIAHLHGRFGHKKWSGFLLNDVAVAWLLAYLASLLWTVWAIRPLFLGVAMMLLQWIANVAKDLAVDLSLPEDVVDALRGLAGEIPMGLQNSLVIALEKYFVYLALRSSGIATAQEVLDALEEYIRKIVRDYK